MEARRIQLAMVMDVNGALAEGLGTKLSVPWTTDYEAVLGARDVEAVFIVSPHHLHESQAIAAAQAGKRIMVEKPLASTVAGAERIVKAAREAEVDLSVWLGNRYEPFIVKGKQFMEAGALGRLLGTQLSYYKQKSAHYSGLDGHGSAGWRGRWDTAGGGVLIMTAIHFLDWLLYLTQLDVTEVSACFDTLESGDEVEDSLAMWMRFENGALGTVNAAACAPGYYRLDSSLVECRLWGEQGHLSLTPPLQFFSSHQFDGKRPERWHPLGPLPASRPLAVEYLDRFADAVLSGKPPEITGMDGIKVQAVVEAAYESGRRRVPVPVRNPDL